MSDALPIADRLHIAWSQREMDRFVFRAALFRRRGEPEARAEAVAERLVQRDRDRDDRRLCLECQHLQPAYRCDRGASIRDVFQRCDHFSWVTP